MYPPGASTRRRRRGRRCPRRGRRTPPRDALLRAGTIREGTIRIRTIPPRRTRPRRPGSATAARRIRHGRGGAQVHLPRRRDDSYPRALARDRRARVRPDVGPHEPLERCRARMAGFEAVEVVPMGGHVGGVDVGLGARLPVVDPAPVLEPRHDPRHRGFARGVARRVAAASKRPEPRRRAREDPQPRRGDAVAPRQVHRGDVAQRASRRERGDARVGDASAAASARVDDRRGIVHERAERGVVQAPPTPRHRQQRVSDVARDNVPERLPRARRRARRRAARGGRRRST